MTKIYCEAFHVMPKCYDHLNLLIWLVCLFVKFTHDAVVNIRYLSKFTAASYHSRGPPCDITSLVLHCFFITAELVLSCRFGVADLALNWCSSYLNQRSQTFHVGVHQSGPHIIDCNVPQGSVLGPLKFISYTEDSADLISHH